MTIKEIREVLKLTQEQFAELLGAPVRTYQNWERGVSKTPLHVQRLAEMLYGSVRDKI